MGEPYQPKVTVGVGEHFNPKCNQMSGSSAADYRTPHAADVAAEAMRKRAERRAAEREYQLAKKAANVAPGVEPQRWLSNDDIS